MRTSVKVVLIGLGLVALLAIGASVLVPQLAATFQGAGADPSAAGSEQDDQMPPGSSFITVRTIHPQRDPSFVLTCHELAHVEPYFETPIYSQVAGRVKFIQKDIGDTVQQGELLIEIDVPDQLEDVALKEATIQQRLREAELARDKVEVAQAAIDVANSEVGQKKALVTQAEATMIFRQKRLNRYAGAARLQALDQLVVEEEERDYQAAKAAYAGALVAVDRAKADLEEAKATCRAAVADVSLKQAFVEAARKDRDRTEALANYARIRAPYDGVVTQRSIDPGSFVQNAATARAEPLLTLARTDIVTVFMKVPDNFAPLVSKSIEAVIQMDALPGETIKGRVTRFSPSVASKDRTMRVEVDLYNGSLEQYRRFQQRYVSTFLRPVGAAQPLNAVTLWAWTRMTWRQHRKGASAFPIFPQVSSETGATGEHHLLPGMTGYMDLRLPSDRAYLLPSGAVYSRAGKPYIVKVKDGKAVWVPVEVQADDGRLLKIAVIAHRMNPKTGQRETVRKELDGTEEIIVSGQGEIADGQAVKATLSEWKTS
jgi:multidrug resistance efflux pump